MIADPRLSDLQGARPRQQSPGRQETVTDHPPAIAFVPDRGVPLQELVHFRLEGCLKHPLGPLANQLVQVDRGGDPHDARLRRQLWLRRSVAPRTACTLWLLTVDCDSLLHG